MPFLRISLLFIVIGIFLLTACRRPKKAYWENGNLQSELNYDDGKLNGKAIWYHANGEKEQEVYYLNNKLDGPLTRWYANGNIETESFYKDGRLEGKSISYNEKGRKVVEEVYVNDTLNGPYLVFHDGGNPKIEGFYEDGFYTGRWVYYNHLGKIVGVGNFERGAGIQKAWWPNGKLRREINYLNNLKNGEERWFDEKGKLQKKLVFKEGVEIRQHTR